MYRPCGLGIWSLVACVIVLFQGCSRPEPVHEGQPLSHWTALFRSDPTRQDAAEALVKIGQPSASSLASLLDESATTGELRSQAAVLLASIGHSRSSFFLATALVDRSISAGALEKVVGSLRRTGADRTAVDLLIKHAVQFKNDPEQSAIAGMGLAALGGERAILLLLQLLSFDRLFEQTYARETGREFLGDPREAFKGARFERIVADAIVAVPRNAATIVEIIRKKFTKDAIVPAYSDWRTEMVSEVVAIRLLQMMGTAAVEPLGDLTGEQHNGDCRMFAVLTLGALGTRSPELARIVQPRLATLANDQHAQVANAVATVIDGVKSIAEGKSIQ